MKFYAHFAGRYDFLFLLQDLLEREGYRVNIIDTGSVRVRGSLSVSARSTVGLMVGVVLVSGVLLLSFVVPGLVVISAAVGDRAVWTE